MTQGRWYLGFHYRLECESYVSQASIILNADCEEEALLSAIEMWKTIGVPNAQGPSVMYVRHFTIEQTEMRRVQ
jgi:hypothetical protein